MGYLYLYDFKMSENVAFVGMKCFIFSNKHLATECCRHSVLMIGAENVHKKIGGKKRL